MQMTTQCDCVSSAHVLPILTTHGIQLCKPREASLGTHAMPAAAHLDPQATTGEAHQERRVNNTSSPGRSTTSSTNGDMYAFALPL
jgi:hypothetical protein